LGKEVFEGAYQIDEILSLAQEFDKHDHTSHDVFDRFIGKIRDDITFNDLDCLLKELPKSIYRVKGMVKTSDVPTPLIVNYSFGNVSFDELSDYSDPSVLIFIGEDIHDDIHILSDKFDFLTISHTHSHEHKHHH
jgi:G3E family GTPase